MDPGEFKSKKAGHVVTTAEGYAAFVPAPLPPKLTFTTELAIALSRADVALGTLAGLAGELPHPAALTAPFLRQEALFSSRIEGGDVTLTELLVREASATPAGSRVRQVDRVWNALATLTYGLECLVDHPLDLDLIRSLHARLSRGEPAGVTAPGEFRTIQLWIGPPGSTLADAIYVPPPARQMLARLRQLETFIAERGRLPDLVQCAMIHAQFQSLHPFVGGNGRLGRIIVVLFLAERQRLPQPLFYPSAYLEAHRREYYTLLQRIRTHGEWLPWLLFFLDGVRETAEHAYAQARDLMRQHARYLATSDNKLSDVVDDLIVSPFISVPQVGRTLRAGDGTARRAVKKLEDLGLLAPVPETSRPRLWVARAILDAMEDPIEDLVGDADEAPEGEPQKSSLGLGRRVRRRSDRLMSEAMGMIDAAHSAGVDIRLAGGLAIRRHCIDLDFMEREYSDVDLVGRSEQRGALCKVFSDLGYVENSFVSEATSGRQLQFVSREALRAAQARRATQAAGEGRTPAASAAGEGRTPAASAAGEREAPGQAHPADSHAHTPVRPVADHVDVFLDVMRMDHDIDMRARLDMDEYAISPVDALIAKAQIGSLGHKDVHDIIALFKDLPLRDVDDDLSIFVPYIAEVCAADWGLYTDITTNLRVVIDWLGDYGLSAAEVATTRERLTAVIDAIEAEEKTTLWHVRARVGKRASWRREVEEAKGVPIDVRPP